MVQIPKTKNFMAFGYLPKKGLDDLENMNFERQAINLAFVSKLHLQFERIKGMKTASLLFFGLAMFLLTGCNGNSSSSDSGSSSETIDYSRSEEEIKDDLEAREKSNPVSYLGFDYTTRGNLLGEKVLEGKLSNSATIASFKDVELKIIGYSKTGAEIGTWEETVYEVFPAGKSKNVKVKVALPSSVKSVDVVIRDASVVD